MSRAATGSWGKREAARDGAVLMMSDSLLFEAGSVFFAFWSLVVAAVGVAAFGRDLLPSKAHLNSSKVPSDPAAKTSAR
ncbi:MAG TPA: hypothetical protein VFO46_21615 [Candidatus Sulfotelmatobacter sp.]|nr:hypothetical protein [Candidatus Sulfotelmatobacter sp.]